MDGMRSGWLTNFFLLGISRWVVVPLAATAIARTNPTPSHDTTAVYPILKSVSAPPLSPSLTNNHLDPDLRLGP